MLLYFKYLIRSCETCEYVLLAEVQCPAAVLQNAAECFSVRGCVGMKALVSLQQSLSVAYVRFNSKVSSRYAPGKRGPSELFYSRTSSIHSNFQQ